MLKKYLKFNLFFVFLFILQITSEIKGSTLLGAFVSSCTVISLAVLLLVSTKLKGRFHKRLFTGLVFALIGNTLFVFQEHSSSYLTYGVIFSLLCYFFYIRAFFLDFSSAPELDKKGARIAIILTAIVSISYYFYIRPDLGRLQLPVLICTIMVSFMLMMAAFRNQRVHKNSFNLILAGVLLLAISNSLWAYHHFVKSFDLARLIITAVYLMAQYFIVMGGITRKLVKTMPAT